MHDKKIMIRHVLLSLITVGGLFTFTGFVLSMFGFSSPCNDPPHCIDGQRILLYKVCGAILLVFGLLMVMLGITLKWRLQSEQLRLESRALSTEGTAFTGDTNLDVSPSSPVEETSPGLEGGQLLRDVRDGEGFPSSRLSVSPGILERHPPQAPQTPGYTDHEKYLSYLTPQDSDVTINYGMTKSNRALANNDCTENDNDDDDDDDDYGFDEVDSCVFVTDGDKKYF